MVMRKATSPLTPELDVLVHQQMDKWKVPGLTMAIVHGSSTWSKAYGIAEFPDRKMTTGTLFSTCSTTKAFASAAVSLAIDDSKNNESPLRWDTPLASIIPDDFVLETDYSTNHTTIEDALSHRSGLSTFDACLVLAHPDRPLREAVRRLRHLPMKYSPRSTFSYNNHMYMTVSHALEQIEGRPFGDIIKARILEPLGMNDTYFSVQEVSKDPTLSPRLARGYTWDVDSKKYVAEPYMNDVAVTGAGAMVSNVLEYTKWLRTMIYQKGPISPEGHAALIQPRTIVTDMSDLVAPPAPHQLYALGWFIHSYRGEPLYWHSGSWVGFGIMVGFLPNKSCGFAMMSNTQNGRHAEVEIFLHLLDSISGGPASKIPRTMGPSNVTESRMPETMSEAMKRLYPCLPDPPIAHSLPLHQYAGRYEHPGIGYITVDIESGHLGANLLDRVTAGILSFDHASGEFFVASFFQPKSIGMYSEYFKAEFSIDASGIPSAMGLDLEPALGEEKIWFRRK
ncbi:hypothetical protein PENANT_c044G04768 [Penicillium antarcticum]|uniref:Beta-lactamase-related domain-containing protein n=1 Tax=Penicillium antarcticum TaxID=416450 RepID=A0A1V6PRZ8_9EURO|nr:uncharacterized protein N7508_003981 [Penicillium antarcticum]KAJ5308602.1 hypothetical protein N7508_003981 [Penicillium antarcticum]OQD79775.1 hypothetical protein PENANT_c044G04768 [Penicillium antarcticum]